MVSLKTKNPFGTGVELVSWKTWIGVGAFTVLAGVVYAGIRYVGGKAEKMASPIDDVWSRIN